MMGKSKQFWYLYSTLAILVLVRIIPFLYPDSRTWGFNHLIFLPAGYTIAFFGIAAVALVLPFIKNSEIWGERFIDWFSITFFESPRKYLYRAIFILLMAALFIIFAAPTHFLGDGYAILKNIASESNTLYKWSEIGVIILLEILRNLAGSPTLQISSLVIQIVSICSGVISIWLFYLLAQIISVDRTKQFFIFAASFCSGTLLLWFGYIEHYPILWIFMTALLYYGIKYIKYGTGLVLLWVFLLIGIALHMQMLIFLPGVIYITLFLKNDNGKKRVGRKYLWYVTIIFGAIVGAVSIYKYFTDIYFQVMFIDITSSSLVDTKYSLFSTTHLIDILNQSILLSPLLLVFITLVRTKGFLNTYKFETVFLIIFSLGCLAFLLLVDPKLGMA